MARKSIEKKLIALSSEIASLQADLRVVQDQLVHFEDEAEDARLRALVAETPQADKVHRDISATASAFRRDRDHKLGKIKKLERRQDELLDQISL